MPRASTPPATACQKGVRESVARDAPAASSFFKTSCTPAMVPAFSRRHSISRLAFHSRPGIRRPAPRSSPPTPPELIRTPSPQLLHQSAVHQSQPHQRFGLLRNIGNLISGSPPPGRESRAQSSGAKQLLNVFPTNCLRTASIGPPPHPTPDQLLSGVLYRRIGDHEFLQNCPSESQFRTERVSGWPQQLPGKRWA